MKKLVSVMILGWMVVFLRDTRAAADDSEPLSPPQGGAPWHHEKTGISIPQKLGSLKMGEGVLYKDPAWGVKLRFTNPDLNIRADVYIYTCRSTLSTDEERKQGAEKEISEVLGGVKQMEQKGHYRNLKWDDGSMREIKLGDNTRSFYFSVPANYEIREGEPPSLSPVRSIAGVLVCRGHYVKIRLTQPADMKKQGREATDEFVNAVLRCVYDASLRETVQKLITDYRKNPESEEGRNNAGGITAIADKSPLVNIVVGPVVMDFCDKCTSHSMEAKLDVLRAFVVGATDAAFHDATYDEMVNAAIHEVNMLTGKWEKNDTNFHRPSMEDFSINVMKENEKNRVQNR